MCILPAFYRPLPHIAMRYCEHCSGGWDWSPRQGEPTQLDEDGVELALDPAICPKCKGFGFPALWPLSDY